MAFVNEKFLQSEKARIDELIAGRPQFVRASGLMPWWTVDRERDAFLVLIGKEGGMPEGTQETQHYALSWEGNIVRFAGDSKRNRNSKNTLITSWRVHRLDAPPSTQRKRSATTDMRRIGYVRPTL